LSPSARATGVLPNGSVMLPNGSVMLPNGSVN